jgi:hypothetical protein
MRAASAASAANQIVMRMRRKIIGFESYIRALCVDSLELPFKHDMVLPFLLYVSLPFKSYMCTIWVIAVGLDQQMSNFSPTRVQFVGVGA